VLLGARRLSVPADLRFARIGWVHSRSRVAGAGRAGRISLNPVRRLRESSHRFQLIYLSESPRPRRPGDRTVKVTARGASTYNWTLGAISRGRYRITMKLPSEKTVKSRHAVPIVCNEARKAEPETFDG